MWLICSSCKLGEIGERERKDDDGRKERRSGAEKAVVLHLRLTLPPVRLLPIDFAIHSSLAKHYEIKLILLYCINQIMLTATSQISHLTSLFHLPIPFSFFTPNSRILDRVPDLLLFPSHQSHP